MLQETAETEPRNRSASARFEVDPAFKFLLDELEIMVEGNDSARCGTGPPLTAEKRIAELARDGRPLLVDLTERGAVAAAAAADRS